MRFESFWLGARQKTRRLRSPAGDVKRFLIKKYLLHSLSLDPLAHSLPPKSIKLANTTTGRLPQLLFWQFGVFISVAASRRKRSSLRSRKRERRERKKRESWRDWLSVVAVYIRVARHTQHSANSATQKEWRALARRSRPPISCSATLIDYIIFMSYLFRCIHFASCHYMAAIFRCKYTLLYNVYDFAFDSFRWKENTC